jgi:DNA polymerase I-like protein with 3'-5' exonuclease and polymerase domains
LQKAYKKEHGKTLYAKDIGYHMLPREVIVPYAKKDAEFTLLLWQKLRPKIKDRLVSLYESEMDLTLVCLDIEARGMAVDIPYTQEKIKEYNGLVLAKELAIADLTGLKVWYPERQGQATPEGCLNPGSWQQLLEVFAARGVKLEDTKNETLLGVDDELAGLILGLRKDKKILDTYLLNILREQRDGIIHPNYKLHVPVTGRMSSAGESGD